MIYLELCSTEESELQIYASPLYMDLLSTEQSILP